MILRVPLLHYNRLEKIISSRSLVLAGQKETEIVTHQKEINSSTHSTTSQEFIELQQYFTRQSTFISRHSVKYIHHQGILNKISL